MYEDMEKAADKLADVMAYGGKIVCAVDFDADGISSGAIFQRAMQDFFGYPKDKCFVQISHRTLWGYGYSEYAVKNIFREHAEEPPALIITADQGSSNEKEVQLTYQMATAANIDLDVIITDHHHIPPQGPDSAYAFINPQKQKDLHQDHKDICGAMVMFLLMLATKEKLAGRGMISSNVRLFELLGNAAVATISDVMSLETPCNRFVCHAGFGIINKSNHPSWTFLRAQQELPIDEEFIGFQLAPRINAGGRVGLSGETGLNFLCAPDMVTAKANYDLLTEANEERKDIGQEMLSEAFELAKEQVEKGRKVIVVYLPNGNSGNSGIVAGKLKEQFHRTALMLAPINATEATGSARSIPGVDIRARLQEVYENHPGIINKYGGHPVAAGMTCEIARIEEFAELLNQAVERHLNPGDLTPVIEVDFVANGLATPVDINFVRETYLLKPYGQKFPPPLLAAQGTVENISLMGKKGKLHARFEFLVEGVPYPCVWFNIRNDESEELKIENGSFATLVLQPSENVFRGKSSLQFRVVSAGKFDENAPGVFI
jgi:single-stranded-DNA-specific exonuclease